jgi:two-component system, NarL family, response regulator LiaR
LADNITILIADDNTMLCAMLASYLNHRSGIQVVGTVNDGQAAVQLVDQLHPDVVLMDIVMPVMDGLSATRIIRERYPHVKVVILTSGFGAQADDALAAGASAYVLKMVSVDEIAHVIRTVHMSRDGEGDGTDPDDPDNGE